MIGESIKWSNVIARAEYRAACTFGSRPGLRAIVRLGLAMPSFLEQPLVQEIWPDVVLPISNNVDRDGCLAVGASSDEVLWLTAPEPLPDGATFAKKTIMQLHSYRSGPEATTRPYAHRRRPHFVQRKGRSLICCGALAG
jgi:hypothetical protein